MAFAAVNWGSQVLLSIVIYGHIVRVESLRPERRGNKGKVTAQLVHSQLTVESCHMEELRTDTNCGIIVLGVFRSGTSLVSQLLHHLGVDFGMDKRVIRGTRDNPGGTFEHRQINKINGRLLQSAGRTFAKPGPPVTLAEEADLRVLQRADLSWTEGETIWGLKDPRFCVTLAAWLEAGKIETERLQIVHVKRNTHSVAKSAYKYPNTNWYFNGSFEAIAEGVKKYQEFAQWHVDNLNLPTLVVQYEELLQKPEHIVAALARFIGVSDEKRIRRAASYVGKKKALLLLPSSRILRKLYCIFHQSSC